jgi:hypothetical protein
MYGLWATFHSISILLDMPRIDVDAVRSPAAWRASILATVDSSPTLVCGVYNCVRRARIGKFRMRAPIRAAACTCPATCDAARRSRVVAERP